MDFLFGELWGRPRAVIPSFYSHVLYLSTPVPQLQDFNIVVPGEVLTPPCILGFGIQRFGYYGRVVIFNVLVVVWTSYFLGSTPG